ncbi:hypothetical protein AC1031_004661 [Aphanomyces cochlioides]|nr:hypothetical protein AC1031_004661 [Aphanomyces cochlioides]
MSSPTHCPRTYPGFEANKARQDKQERVGVEKAPKTVWTTDMVKTLLDKRLKREFSAIRLAEKATGNEVNVVYPPYWDDAVAALGNKTGLGHHDYAFGANNKGRDSDDSSNDNLDILPQSNRQAIFEAELSRQRAKRTKKLDIGQSLVALGQSLAEGMKVLRTPAPSDNNQVQETSKLIAAIDKLQVAVEQSSSIQSEPLEYLRRNNSN